MLIIEVTVKLRMRGSGFEPVPQTLYLFWFYEVTVELSCHRRLPTNYFIYLKNFFTKNNISVS